MQIVYFQFPTDLTLICNNLNNNVINFLDLKILLHNNNIFIDIFDKRKEFSFQVNAFTSFNSCLHLSIYKKNFIKSFISYKNYVHHVSKVIVFKSWYMLRYYMVTQNSSFIQYFIFS